MTAGRILVTGSRAWTSKNTIIRALSDASALIPAGVRITLVHGGAKGADTIAGEIWRDWVKTWPGEFDDAEVHMADWDTHGKKAGFIRNADMVKLGADVVVAFADSYASGTGHCARLARKAGLKVIDYGVSTSVEARPEVAA